MDFVRIWRWRMALSLLALVALTSALACAAAASAPERPAWPELADCMHNVDVVDGERWSRGEITRAVYYTTVAERCGERYADSRSASLSRLLVADCVATEYWAARLYLSKVREAKNAHALASAYSGYACAERSFDAFMSGRQ